MVEPTARTLQLIERARTHLEAFEAGGKSHLIAFALNNLETALNEARWSEEHDE